MEVPSIFVVDAYYSRSQMLFFYIFLYMQYCLLFTLLPVLVCYYLMITKKTPISLLTEYIKSR